MQARYSNPGKKHDDDVMYGSGQSSDPAGTGNTTASTGQGSHLTGSRGEADPVSSSTAPSSGTTTGAYAGTTSGVGQQPGYTGNPTLRPSIPPVISDGASNASIKSGVVGYPQSQSGLIDSSGTGPDANTMKPLPDTPASRSTGATDTAGPHASNLANRADPRVDSDLDGSRRVGAGNTATGAPGSALTDRSVGRWA